MGRPGMSAQVTVGLTAVLVGALVLALVTRAPTDDSTRPTASRSDVAPADRPRAKRSIMALGPALALPAPPGVTDGALPAPYTGARSAAVTVDRLAVPAPVLEPSGPRLAARMGSAAAGQGRTLLRLLEHGQGPAIELAWPDDDKTRERLYRRFSRCHGMRLAVADSGGALFTLAEAPGRPWSPDLDRFSGYMRAPAGAEPAAELVQAAAIRRHHGLADASAPVRLFPRAVDADLLAGLRALIGPHYRTARKIRGRYDIGGDGVLVRSLSVDGRPVGGLIALRETARCTR